MIFYHLLSYLVKGAEQNLHISALSVHSEQINQVNISFGQARARPHANIIE